MMYSEESLLWQIWKRRFLVFSFLILLLCLTVLPIWQKIGIQPTLLLIILYHWSIYRSDLLSIEQLVLISLILDGTYAYPLGFSALRLLIAYTLDHDPKANLVPSTVSLDLGRICHLRNYRCLHLCNSFIFR